MKKNERRSLSGSRKNQSKKFVGSRKKEDKKFSIKKNSQDPGSEPPRYNLKQRKQDSAGPKKPSDSIRLNKYIANAGVCSRRDADALIASGKIIVNGKVITQLGHKVNKSDTVVFDGKVLQREKLVYVLLNKPKDFITTMDDPENRRTVMQLVTNACDERIYPVGRLDRNTTGLLLFTNDGEVATKLSHPSRNIRKIYQVELGKPITKVDFDKITEGLTLEDGEVKVDDLAIVSSDKKTLGIEIHVGRNRIVRRIFEHLRYEVVKLDRVVYAGLTKKDLKRGRWRYLTEKEVVRLKYLK
ncbi:pseudouridine synthase [Splendidivirga corallicola]|uniref:pseudouridine synthase n=1 Tax=Splendidivirga corallicola TaxID=3051826 RepID=UPI003211BCCB